MLKFILRFIHDIFGHPKNQCEPISDSLSTLCKCGRIISLSDFY